MNTNTGPADALAALRSHRLDLADILRAVLPIARAYRDEQREREIRTLLTRLAADRFQLALVGQFSRGKTTLMNALLGRAYLPMGALPVTSVVTTVRYGARSRALVRSRATDLPLEVPLTELVRYVTQTGADRGRIQVTSAEVEIPAELLRLGFEFVDTPGVGSAIAANTAATLQYLPQADAIVFVTGFDSAITAAEAEFLIRAASQAGKLFLVINKRDLVSDSAAAEVTDYVRNWAHQQLGPDGPQVFGLSALQALEAIPGADAGLLTASGLPSFRSALIAFLTTGQASASLQAVARAASTVVICQQRDLNAGRLPPDSGRERATVLAEFEAKMASLQDQMAVIGKAIANQIADVLPGLLARQRQRWQDGLHELIASASALGAGTPDEAAEAALAALTEAGREPAAGWLAQTAGEVRDMLITTTANDIGILLELARSPRRDGAVIAGLPAMTNGPAGWSGADLSDLLLPTVQWVVPDTLQLTRRGRRRRLTADQAAAALADALAAAVAGFVDRASSVFQAVAAEWAVRLHDEAARHAQAETAQVRRYLQAPPREEDLAVLEGLAIRLAGYQNLVPAAADTDGAPSARPDPGTWSQIAPPAISPRSCVICGELESALTEYLIHRQFLLASSEEEQARHAATGGFCPLHTWQYAHLGSPVGISAGNARLAEAAGTALQAASTVNRTVGEMAEAVARLTGTDGCPACKLLADTQQQSAARLAATTPADAPAALCLRHLGLFLEAGPAPDAAATTVAMLASALHRAAEDMRSYALKREALRRSLVTADEADAYRHALRMLAGLPGLAQPWEPDPDQAPSAR